MRIRVVMLCAAAAVLVATSANAGGDAKAGEQVFARCAICHSATKGEGNRIGPNLFGIVGRKAGSVPDFYYSAALKNAGFVWTNDKLDAYIKAPQSLVPGNRMAFAGLPSASQRADLIAYLDSRK